MSEASKKLGKDGRRTKQIGKAMYKNTGKTHEKPILWGAPEAAFSGKTRSYFIKMGIVYEEIFPFHLRYQNEIMPLIGYFVMPVIE